MATVALRQCPRQKYATFRKTSKNFKYVDMMNSKDKKRLYRVNIVNKVQLPRTLNN